jgi:ssRNA-specific RNase YbeY (16S rRNA maturation enzyme)
VVHGVLHLLGHDHYTAAEKNVMWKAQAAVLKKLGAAISEPQLG